MTTPDPVGLREAEVELIRKHHADRIHPVPQPDACEVCYLLAALATPAPLDVHRAHVAFVKTGDAIDCRHLTASDHELEIAAEYARLAATEEEAAPRPKLELDEPTEYEIRGPAL